eukprot:406259_1
MSSDIIFESSLEYFSFRQKKYKEKWTQLTRNNILLVIDKERNGKIIKRIDLNVYDNIIKLENKTKSKANDYQFLLTSTLNTKKTPYKFRAHSKKHMNEWTEYIKKYQCRTIELKVDDQLDEDTAAARIIADISDSDMNVLMLILNDSTQQNNNQFITWDHIIYAVKQQLYNNVSNAMNKIINNKENNVKQNDFCHDAIHKVLNMLTNKKSKMSREEYIFIQELIEKAKNFQPFTKDFKRDIGPILCRRFSYRYDFDKRGLFYCLGTNGDLNCDSYTNPAKIGAIELTSSKLKHGESKLYALTGRVNTILSTKSKSKKGGFFCINLKNTKIRLTEYSLRYYNLANRRPRNWQLMGSNDGKIWDILKVHEDDRSLKVRGDTFTWPIKTCMKFYSYFKLKSIGFNGEMLALDYRLSISGMELYGDVIGGNMIMANDIHNKYPGLTMNLLQDIYDVHRSFQFKHFHMIDYKPKHYVNDILNNMYLEQPGISKRFGFNPTYIINDNLFDVIHYIYAVSSYIHKTMNSMKQNKHEIRILIICKAVECVFDDKLIFPYNIDTVEQYLKGKKQVFAKNHIISDFKSVENVPSIENVITNTIEKNKQLFENDSNLLIIIDRRGKINNDSIFVTKYKEIDNELNELNKNYFIGMTFNILNGNEICAYLTYAIKEKLRFYPEQLISIVPRLFKKPLSLNPYQFTTLLYSESYRHGFCLNLNNNNFNMYYKRITKT